MRNAFDRAERWRQRAAELRGLADRMSEHKARSSLQVIAASLEMHARKIEEMALKIHRVHQRRQPRQGPHAESVCRHGGPSRLRG